MLNLFRKNDPFLNILLIIVLIVLRLLYTFLGSFEFLNETQPSSYLLDQVFHITLNTNGHIWLSALFVMFNMLLINDLVRSNQAFDENNYLAGFIYLILAHMSSEQFILSGGLIASTCLILALRLILSHVKQRASEENIFFTGFLLGLAALFYSPLLIYLPIVLLIYVFYTRTIPRRYLLSTFAFCFPFLLIFSISLYTKIDVSFKFFFTGLFSDNLFALAPLDLVFIFYPLIFTFYKLLTSFSGFKMTNHQIHFQRVMFLVFLSTVYVFFAHANGDGFLWLFIIPATYFISKGILEIEKKWVRTLAFFLVLLQTVYPYLLAANL